MYKIRKARIQDVPKIQKLIAHYADKRKMLHRPLSELYEHMQGFFVVERRKTVVACCSLSITWEDLSEIKALAVSPKNLGNGLGARLITECEKEALKLGINRMFVLTYVPRYFMKFGYRRISRNKLPHKVWSECVRCPFFPNCNEIPMIKTLKKGQ